MRPRWLIVAALLVVLAFSARYLTAQTLPFPSGGVASSVSSGTSGPPSLFPNGTVTRPSIAFAAQPDVGFYRPATNQIGLANTGARGVWTATEYRQLSVSAFSWSSSSSDAVGISADAGLSRPIASVVQSNGSSGGGLVGTGSFAFYRLIATGSSPNCIDNCGPASASIVVGTDAAWRLTITTANAQSNFSIGFRTAYTGAPNCIAQLAGTGTASVASTNSTATGVTVNLTTAPSNGQVYHGQCYGMTIG